MLFSYNQFSEIPIHDFKVKINRLNFEANSRDADRDVDG